MIFEFSGLLNLIPEETDELLQRIDQPLTEETDQATVRFSVISKFSYEGLIPQWIKDLIVLAEEAKEIIKFSFY